MVVEDHFVLCTLLSFCEKVDLEKQGDLECLPPVMGNGH